MASRHATDFNESENLPVTYRVLDAIAKEEEISPLEVDPPLAAIIDPDALNDLFRNGKRGVYVEFTYRGYQVVIKGEDHITVNEEHKPNAEGNPM